MQEVDGVPGKNVHHSTTYIVLSGQGRLLC